MMKDSSLLGCDPVFQVFHRILKNMQFTKNSQCRRREAKLGYSRNGISSWSGVSQPSGGGMEAACVLVLKKGHFQFNSVQFNSHGVVKTLVNIQ